MQLALCLIFFLSGASALIFETLWFRMAGLAFGNSVWASSLVLAGFMGGLALGSLLVARYGGRWGRPLRLYAIFEVAIGVTGMALVVLLPGLASWLAPVFRPFLDAPWVLNPLRLAIAFALLLIPATAMGATLPVLVRTMVRHDENFGRVLGRLYGWNTFGAVAGALSAELLLIGALGIRGAGFVAATLNLVAAALVIGLVRRTGIEDVALPESPVRWGALVKAPALLAAAFLSGAVLLAIEVVWFRMMLLFRNSTSLVFALMLAVVLFGIAAGGLIASWWLRHRPYDYRHVTLVALVSGMVVTLTYYYFVDTLGLLSAAPVSLLSGILFTFLGRALNDELGDETLSAAGLTFSNTIGAMLGSLVAGFVLIPRLGVEDSFFVLAVVYGLIALLVAYARRAELTTPDPGRLRLGVAGVGFVLALTLFPNGRMENHYLPRVLGPYLADGSHVIAMREGVTEAAFYLQNDLFGVPRYHRLVTNGFAMSATTYRAKRYMRLYAYWPMALNPDARDALLISYGIGVTAKALTENERLESIDVVDISRDLVELSLAVDIFPGRHPLKDPRVRVHIEDGRFFLQTTPKQYDVITAEPPPPKNAGIVNLYSQEYFTLLHERLAPGGVVTYWLPVYQLEVGEAKSLVKGFCEAFSDCSVWTGAGMEWMLVGTRGLGGRVDRDAFERPWRKVASGLTTIGVEVPEQLGALFLGDSAFLAEWTGGALPLQDNYPHRIHAGLLHQETPDIDDHRTEYLRVLDASAARRRFRESPWIRDLWPAELHEQTFEYFEYQSIINQHLARGGAGIPELHQVLTETSLESLPLMLMASDLEDRPILEKASEGGVSHPMLDFLLAAHAFAARDYELAREHLLSAQKKDPNSAELARFRVLALVLTGKGTEANRLAEKIRDPKLSAWLAAVRDEVDE